MYVLYMQCMYYICNACIIYTFIFIYLLCICLLFIDNIPDDNSKYKFKTPIEIFLPLV